MLNSNSMSLEKMKEASSETDVVVDPPDDRRVGFSSQVSRPAGFIRVQIDG